jgi:glycosyltransferase involved in cell wall biosynthesis
MKYSNKQCNLSSGEILSHQSHIKSNLDFVTVYIPTHNRAKLVKRAILSVLNQTYPNIEIIVVDDCSSDNTHSELLQFIEKKQIIYLRNDPLSGAPKTRNKAISHAKGKYITGLDDDDYFLQNRIQEFVNCYKPCYSFISSGQIVKSASKQKTAYTCPEKVNLKKIMSSNIVGNQIFTETYKLREIGGYDESLPAWQDYDLWIRLIKTFGTARKIGLATYVFDQSHPHERISNNLDKIYSAYKLFQSKYPEYTNDTYYRGALTISLYNYDKTKYTAATFFQLALTGNCYRALRGYLSFIFTRNKPGS